MSTYITKRAKELGLKKRDARKPLLVEVKKSDVAGGKQNNPEHCGFARACKRADNSVKAVYFFLSTAWVEREGELTRYVLPPSVQKEIVSFDRAKILDPGVYQLSAPSKSSRMSEVRKRSKKRPGRHQPANSTIKRKFRHKTGSVRTVEDPSK